MIPPTQLTTRKSITVFALVVLVSMSMLVQATYAGPAVTERVSISSEGVEADKESITPSISADGRFIAFASRATNLIPDDSNGKQDIFVHDWVNGTTERISRGLDDAEPNGDSAWPAISADGNFVAFSSTASNLVSGDTNGVEDVFISDLTTGETERVSLTASSGQANGPSYEPVVSEDGRYVAFVSTATNLYSGATYSVEEIYYFDRMNRTLRWLSGPAGLDPSTDSSYELSMSSDGSWVVFSSNKSNLVVNDSNGVRDIFLWSKTSNSLERVNLSQVGLQADRSSYHPSVSDDGRFIAFRSFAGNLIASEIENYSNDIFRRDRQAGTTERVNVPYDGVEVLGSNSGEPVISADGRFIAFRSDMSNLVAGDTNSSHDVFVRDMQGSVSRISENSNSAQADAGSFGPAINADGSVTVFYSDATNLDLIREDTNGFRDVFSQGDKPEPEPTPTPTETVTPDPTETETPVPTETATPVPTETDTPVPTETDTPVPTETATPVPTETDTPVPTETETPVPTETETPVPTETDTPTPEPTDPVWPRDLFNLTSMCKLDTETGQMRVRNMSTEVQPFTMFNLSDTYYEQADAPIGDSLWPVPWTSPSDTFILHIAGHDFVKAIGDNPLCDPEPTDTPEPTETPEPTDTPTPKPTDPPTEATWRLDFERDAFGAELAAGTIIDDEWSPFGINVSTNNPEQHPAMIFDSSQPSGHDWDLGSPNEDFGGPGRGSGGEAGMPGENSKSLDNVLIITEDLDSDDPDDYYAGGTLIFTFDEPMDIEALQLLDIDINEANGKIVAFASNGEKLGMFSMQPLGNNSVQWVQVELKDVAKMTVKLQSSGALAAISFYGEQPRAGDPEPTPDPTEEPDPTPTDEPSDPPVVELVSELSLLEGEEFEINGTFSDPDSEQWTAVVDYGDGQSPKALELSEGTFDINGVYGDNGEYELKVSIQDGQGAVGSAVVDISVKNDYPEISSTELHNLENCHAAGEGILNGKARVACAVGDFLIAKVGEKTAFTFNLSDPGSDDLTVSWDFGKDVTYFNDESAPDPFPSPLGEYPYSVTHVAEVVFEKPGVKHVHFTLQDDDDGKDTLYFKVLVRNNHSCKASLGDWISYFMQNNKDEGLEGELRAHLSILSGFVSSAFGDLDPAAINALEEFILEDMDQTARARAEMLTAWLNFVNGAMDWDDVVESANGSQELKYSEALHQILTILLDEDASSKELQEAIKLAQAINSSNKGGGNCGK